MTTDVTTYFRKNLRLNPVVDAEEILANRDVFLGKPVVATVADSPFDAKAQQRRENYRARLDKVRSNFWVSSLTELSQQLRSLDVREYPELTAAVNKLKKLSVVRPEFPKLAQHPRNHPDLFSILKSIVVLPPIEAAEVRERSLRRLGRNPELKNMQRMIRMMKREFPEIYELEREWLDSVCQLKLQTDGTVITTTTDSEGCGVPGWVIFWLIVTIIRILMTSM